MPNGRSRSQRSRSANARRNRARDRRASARPMRALRRCGHPLLNRNRAKGGDRRAYMRAWRARNPDYMARKGREHRERRRLAALALAATNEDVNEGQ